MALWNDTTYNFIVSDFIEHILCKIMKQNYRAHVVNGHERDRIQGRTNVHGTHRSCFSDKKFYGSVYTERQLAIIAGEYVPGLQRNHITLIVRKAEQLGDYDTAEHLYELYKDFFRETYPDDPSPEEALDILDSLTPDDLK